MFDNEVSSHMGLRGVKLDARRVIATMSAMIDAARKPNDRTVAGTPSGDAIKNMEVPS